MGNVSSPLKGGFHKHFRDYALTKQSALGLVFGSKPFFKRLNERLSSSTVWTLSRAFSIPSAALSASPVATLHAAAADIARAFRSSICSWRFYFSTMFILSKQKSLGQLTKIFPRWILEECFLVEIFRSKYRIRIHGDSHILKYLCKIFKRCDELLGGLKIPEHHLRRNRIWERIKCFKNGIPINNIDPIHVNFARRFINDLQNRIRVFIHNLKPVGIIIYIPFVGQIGKCEIQICIHKNSVSFVYERNQNINKKTVARHKWQNWIIEIFPTEYPHCDMPFAWGIIRHFFHINSKTRWQIFYQKSRAGFVGVAFGIINCKSQIGRNMFCKSIRLIITGFRFIMFNFSHPARLVHSQFSKENSYITAPRRQFWRLPAHRFCFNCYSWIFAGDFVYNNNNKTH
jgi:hypothetical protein